MWFRRNKNSAPEQPPTPAPTVPGQPRRHARDPHALQAALPAEALILAEPVRAWLANDVERLEEAAARNEADAEKMLANAAEWRTVAAGYRRILDLAEVTALRGEQDRLEREAAYDEPQPLPAPADIAEFAATWRVPAPLSGCACDPIRGESCEQCDMPLPPRTSWWSPSASNDGLTAPLAAVDGEAR